MERVLMAGYSPEPATGGQEQWNCPRVGLHLNPVWFRKGCFCAAQQQPWSAVMQHRRGSKAAVPGHRSRSGKSPALERVVFSERAAICQDAVSGELSSEHIKLTHCTGHSLQLVFGRSKARQLARALASVTARSNWALINSVVLISQGLEQA